MAVAAALIGIGIYRLVTASSVSAEDRARCEEIVRSTANENQDVLNTLLPKCAEHSMVIMMDAQAAESGAETAAQNIASANQTSSISKVINFFLIGIGAGLLLIALVLGRRRS